MKKTLCTLSFFSFIFAFSIGNAAYANDFQKGVEAYTSKDYMTALKEFSPLVEQKFAPAQFFIGTMFVNGEGLPKDEEIALLLFNRAARQGFVNAQASLGAMYTLGKGTQKDTILGYMWLHIASIHGFENAKTTLPKLEEQLSPANIEMAQKRANECIQKNYLDC